MNLRDKANEALERLETPLEAEDKDMDRLIDLILAQLQTIRGYIFANGDHFKQHKS